MLERIEASGFMDEKDTLALRREVFPDGTISDEGFERLCAFLDAAPQGCVEWEFLLNDAFTDIFLRRERPERYFSAEGTARLAQALSTGNRGNMMKTGVLVHLLDNCRAAPPELALLAQKMIEADVLADGRVSATDAKLLRKLVYSQGSESGLGISRGEADLLFTINDYSRADENDPAWLDLFTKAIACHLMVQHGYVGPTREEALRQDDWVTDTSVNLPGFMGSMARGMFEIFGRRDRTCLWAERNAHFEQAAAAAEQITPEEAAWLASRIERDGRYCAAEQALIGYIKGLCDVDLPQILQRYEKAA